MTVTWPNGRTESFDLTPSQGSTFFKLIAPDRLHRAPGQHLQAGALARRRGASYLGNGNLSGGAFGSDGIYDRNASCSSRRTGCATCSTGRRVWSRRTDRNGNTVTVSADGVTSSAGPSIRFTRTNGRITHINGPSGLAVDYGYEEVT